MHMFVRVTVRNNNINDFCFCYIPKYNSLFIVVPYRYCGIYTKWGEGGSVGFAISLKRDDHFLKI